jgi:limonene-1,2-epoxide hydrolase
MGAQAFRAAVEAGDLDGLMAALAPDVVFHSPVTFSACAGTENVRRLLGIVLETFEDFRYTDELAGDGTHILVFRTRVGDKEIEGLDLLRFGHDGLVEDFTVMVRPLSGAIALAQAVGPRLEAAKTGGPAA